MFGSMKTVLMLCTVAGANYGTLGQAPTKAVRISDSVYMARGSGNVYMVTTPAGNVIIDTSSRAGAANARQLLTAENSGPVRYII